MSITLHQTVIDEKLAAIKKDQKISDKGAAFLYFVYSMYFDLDEEEIPPEDLIEGSGEKQIDIINVDDQAEHSKAHITIIQTKNSPGFKSNEVILIANGLSWIFEAPKSQFKTLTNKALLAKIEEIRDLRQSYGSANLSVSVLYATKGDAAKLPNEYIQERDKLLAKWTNAGFAHFKFAELGAKELFERLNEIEASNRRIDADIRIHYDVNRPSIIQQDSAQTRSIVCTISGNELARIVTTEPANAIFDKNIRRYLGAKGRVNSQIYESCTNPERAGLFWCLNNGVTMVCDSFDFVPNPDKPIVKVKNVQIVNGCQTSMTLKAARDDGRLLDNVSVQAKIYSTMSQTFVDNLVLSTNNQNSINSRDLSANESTQILIQKIMKDLFGYYYEKKMNEFRADKTVSKKKIVHNAKAGQAYLAVCKKKPTVARAQKYKLFTDEYYGDIFDKVDVGHMLLSYLIYNLCRQRGLSKRKDFQKTDTEYSICTYGVFHVSRIVGFHLFSSEQWPNSESVEFKEALATFSNPGAKAEGLYDQAFKDMLTTMQENADSIGSPNNYFKSARVQTHINKKLHPKDAGI
jgi:hypothetical protein